MSDIMTTEHAFKPGTLGDAERNAESERQAAKWEAAARERQAERERIAHFHSVTVTTLVDDEGTEDEYRRVDRVKFTCTAAAEAECRTYPKHCGCEAFEWNEARTHDIAGHPRTSGNDCWMQDWFDSEGAVYVGADEDDRRDDYVPAIDRTGLIIVAFSDEWIEWDWFTPKLTDSETESETT